MFTTTTTTTTTTTPTAPPATKMLKATRHYTIRDASRRIRTKFPKTQAAIPHHRHYEREEKNEPSTSPSTSTSSTVSSSKTLLAATALAVVLSTMAHVGSAIAGDDDDKKFVRNMLGGCTPDKLDLFKDSEDIINNYSQIKNEIVESGSYKTSLPMSIIFSNPILA